MTVEMINQNVDNLICEFTNNKTKSKCNNNVVEGSKYCKKHKRYDYGNNKRDVEYKQENNNIIQHQPKRKRITPEVNNNITTEKIGNIDMSNITVDFNDDIISIQNNKFIDDIHNQDKQLNGEPYDESADFETDKTNNSSGMHDSAQVGEMLFPFLVASADLVEKASELTQDRTNVIIRGMVEDTISKEKEYKKLIAYAYEEDPATIDSVISPGKAILAHFVASGLKSAKIEKKNNQDLIIS